MNKFFAPWLYAIGASMAALLLTCIFLISTDNSISPRVTPAYKVAEQRVGFRIDGKPNPDRVIPLLKPAFNATIAILTPEGRVVCAGTILKNKAGESIKVLTADHCIARMSPTALVPVGFLSDSKVRPMIVQKRNEDWDLALLVSLWDATEDGPEVEIAANPPPLGDTVWIIGHPKGLLGNVTRGVLSNILHFTPELRYYRIDAAIFYGNSGGGLFDSSGKLIGVGSMVEYSRNPDGSTQLVPGGGLCVSLYNINKFVGKL